MIGKLKWTAILLVFVALLLGTRAFVLISSSGHLGSPIAQTCQRLSATAPHDNSLQAPATRTMRATDGAGASRVR